MTEIISRVYIYRYQELMSHPAAHKLLPVLLIISTLSYSFRRREGEREGGGRRGCHGVDNPAKIVSPGPFPAMLDGSPAQHTVPTTLI